MKTKPPKPRRATILLMVVSLLALLFVIVTGFLALARVDRGVVVDLARGELADAITEDIDALAIALIKDQLADDAGRVLGGGDPQSYSNEDVSGYRQSNWLAPLEPVWDPAWLGTAFGWSGSWTVLEQLRWPAVTSLDGSVALPQPFRLYELMRDYNFGNLIFQIADVQWNARNPFGDADGDGVPDSHFLLTAPATELANTAARRSVQVPAYDPDALITGGFVSWMIPPLNGSNGTLNDERWQRYDQQARYEAAVRIISHGGMVTLDSPTLYAPGNVAVTPFNRHFVVDLFDAVRPPTERNSMASLYPFETQEQHALFDALHANAPVIERFVRRRFQIPGAADEQYHRYRPVPPVLAELQGELGPHSGFPVMFGTLPTAGDFAAWQRVNLAGGEGGAAAHWGRQAAFEATRYNNTTAPNDPFLSDYLCRHVITTANYSDDLARKQDPNDPDPAAPDLNDRLGTYRGELKFYLGEIGKAFIEVDQNGNRAAGTGRYRYDAVRGRVIVEELIRRYYDMLGGHSDPAGTSDDWKSLFDTTNDSGKQAVDRRQQAIMLAVNTLASAAPRNTNDQNDLDAPPGFIDAVRYRDDRGTADTTDDVIYIGYTPQPFFSEVILSLEAEEDPQEEPDEDPNKLNYAVAIELYNPNDPYYDFTASPYLSGLWPDVHALPAAQFAISVDEKRPGDETALASWALLTSTGAKYVNGRSFLTMVAKNDAGMNNHFNGTTSIDPVTGLPLTSITLPLEDTSSGGGGPQQLEPLVLTLWRKADVYPDPGDPFVQADAWYPIDRIELQRPTSPAWRSKYRDTSPTRYFGMVDLNGDGVIDPTGEDTDGDSMVDTYARWNLAASVENARSRSGQPMTASLNNHKWLDGALVVDPDVLGAADPFGPTAPLITMNAGPGEPRSELLHVRLNNLPMFGNPGDLRPRSFPTVGFLLFTPRFSHVYKPAAASSDDKLVPVPRVLKRQWRRQPYSMPANYPADFGHMPIFDNTQSVPSASYFDNTDGVGELPWGLLVFDYFTTVNPVQDRNADKEPDVDPLRIPGRININAAPWYVLANLPMLGPNVDTGHLPIVPTEAGVPLAAFPSPSFWDPVAGVLLGWGGWDGSAYTIYRQISTDPTYTSPGFELPYGDITDAGGRYRVGPWLAQAAAAYRDGVQYVHSTPAQAPEFYVYGDSHQRNLGAMFGLKYRRDTSGGVSANYGMIRGTATAGGRPTQFGFVTVGELLNAKGFDSSRHSDLLIPSPIDGAIADTTVARGDFVKAVSLLVLLDSQYLTTRSNTFTIYASVMDRENPQASVRSQTTVDRSNLLPRLTYAYSFYDTSVTPPGVRPCNPSNPLDPAFADYPLAPLLLDVQPMDGTPETPMRLTNDDAEPQIIARQRVGYFNARYDD